GEVARRRHGPVVQSGTEPGRFLGGPSQEILHTPNRTCAGPTPARRGERHRRRSGATGSPAAIGSPGQRVAGRRATGVNGHALLGSAAPGGRSPQEPVTGGGQEPAGIGGMTAHGPNTPWMALEKSSPTDPTASMPPLATAS